MPRREHPRPSSISRRRFNVLGLASMGALAPWLAGCGGGSEAVASGGDLVPERAAAQGLPPGMIAMPPWIGAGPGREALAFKSLDQLADQRIALVWTESALAGVPPLRLRVRLQACQGSSCAGPVLTLMDALVDPGAAATVLPDGSTLVVWREQTESYVGYVRNLEQRLLLRRFGVDGTPAGPAELVDSFIFSGTPAAGGRTMDPPAIGHWPDGSFLVAWADVRTFGSFPGLAASVRARRYHANGWPVAPANTVSVSSRERSFSLKVLADTGGYVISHVQRPVGPFYQAILPIGFWNPLPAEPLAELQPGSFLLSIGTSGSLLFARRVDPATGESVATREYFTYQAQPHGEPVVLRSLPSGAIALRDGQFIALYGRTLSGGRLAQRTDKYGQLLGASFEMPDGPAIRLRDGSLLASWTQADAAGNTRVWLQRFLPGWSSPTPPLAVY